MNENLPIFLNNNSTKVILNEVATLIPAGTQVYLFGGAVRNALYYTYFNEEMTQRDFDCIVIGDGEKFAENLTNAGFIFGNKNTDKAKVLKKNRIPSPIHKYDDWLYLDCKIYPASETAMDILARISDFTIGAVALELKEIKNPEWKNKIIAIPHSLEDIQQKKLTIVKRYVTSFHKIIRMVSRGFQKPSKDDVENCVEKLKEIDEEKFNINTEKTVRYVGSEEKVLEIAKDLGINFNILSLNDVRNYRSID